MEANDARRGSDGVITSLYLTENVAGRKVMK